ncbi:unnamed protein product [Cylicocyclus nassatus]|uniref:Uncharacterized protein n=1 Tax=Cylicocyclus nassatus TaxID=53992 RepID=A0AA36HIH6_CYLNA|nr:unnamed protein product [Cylicocyclus nassatus]
MSAAGKDSFATDTRSNPQNHEGIEPVKVHGRLLPPPKIKYQNETAFVRYEKWRTPRRPLLVPAECDVWAVYALVPTYEAGRFDEECCEQIKLWERELEMVTQNVKLSNALKVSVVLRLQKTHTILLKLGGLNYEMDLEGILPQEGGKDWIRPGRLFLGSGISHPPPSATYDPEKGTHSRDTPSSATLSALGAKNIKTVFIVAQKEHNVRLVLDRIERSRKPTDQIITLEL